MKLTMERVTLGYAQGLFKASKPQNGQGEPKFGSPLIFSEKTHPALVTALKAAIQKVATEQWKDKASAIYAAAKSEGKVCLRDGDGRLNRDGDRRPEYAGKLYINAKSKQKPLLLKADARTQIMEDDGTLYSGCLVTAIVDVKAYDIPNVAGARGVRAELLGVQFVGDGPRLSGGATVSLEDFKAIPEEKPAQGASAAPAAGASQVDPFS